MADEITASGKYFLVSVPEFANDPVGPRSGQPMTSFLRLGAFHEHPENEEATQRALALAQHALVVSKVQGGHLTEPYGAEIDTSITGVEGKGVFLDDQRNADPPGSPSDTAATSLPVSERMAQSAALLTRGGWWDHSDGNRVSTTYGDKVEVIRGNYKMVVMSRQDTDDGAGGFDLSGGHLQDLGPASMPGASVRVEFRPGMFGQRGTWHLENTTNNFIQTSDYAGDFFEHWYGNLKETVTGSEHPEEWNAALSKPYGNPSIKEKTWARKIESYTGSAAWRIPEIIEVTYARTTSARTDVSGDTSETTIVGGGTTATTTVGGGTVEATTVGGGTVETTVVGGGTVAATVVGGATLEASVTGLAAIEASLVGGAKAGLSVVGLVDAEVSIALLKLGIAIAARSIDIRIGGQTNITTSDAIELHLGPKFKLSPVESEITPIKDQISVMQTELSTNKTQINTLYDVLAGQVILL